MALAGSGHEVVNLAVALGRPAERARREAELREACARAGFALRISSPPHDIGRGDDLVEAQARLIHEVVVLGVEEGFGLLLAPSPHDGHHGHEVVGRAAVAAAAALRVPLWMWGLWSDLALPTILHTFEQPISTASPRRWRPMPASWREMTMPAWSSPARRRRRCSVPSGCLGLVRRASRPRTPKSCAKPFPAPAS